MSRAKLIKLIDKLNGIENFLIRESDKIIDKNKSVLVAQNTQQMKEDGQESTGQPIEYKHSRKTPAGQYGAYSKPYEKYKGDYGGETKYVDLFLTGKFHKSIILFQMNPGEWRFVSEDEKAPFLVANYGPDIFGIQEDRLDTFSVGMGVELQSRTDKYLSA